MAADGFWLTPEYKQELDEVIRHYRRLQKTPDLRLPASAPRSFPGILVVCLLEDIESGQSGRAAVLEKGSSNERQLIEVQGNLDGTETFRINFTPSGSQTAQQTELLSVLATPAQVQAALEALDAFNPGDLRVQLGRHVRTGGTTFTMYRWLVEFTGQYAGADVPLLDPQIASGNNFAFTVSQKTFNVDTGVTTTVTNTLPVGTPTPLKKSAICNCGWSHTYGWVILSAEPRQISAVY